jgi:hypothetical protein
MTGRRWSEVKADAVARQPWLASDEAREQRAAIRAENLGRIRGHELAEMRTLGPSPADDGGPHKRR